MPIMKKKAKPKQRKTVPKAQQKRLPWSNKSMETAMETVMNGKTSINKATVMYNMPCTSLKDQLSGKVVHGTRPGPKRYLNEIEEKVLADHLIEATSIGYGMTRREVILITEKVAIQLRHTTIFLKKLFKSIISLIILVKSITWMRVVFQLNHVALMLSPREGRKGYVIECLGKRADNYIALCECY